MADRPINTGLTPAMLRAAAEGRGLDAGTPEAIRAAEKAGRDEIVKASDRLPVTLFPDKSQWEKIGFQFGAPIDDLFQAASLPDGWEITPTEHAMNSDIRDDRGRRRANLFYKAAFYDRSAHANLVCRYRLGSIYGRDPDTDVPDDHVQTVIFDADEILRRLGDPVPLRNVKAEQAAKDAALKWLAEHYPEHNDPTAYWHS